MKTGHKPRPPQSALGRVQSSSIDCQQIKSDGWHRDGWLVIHIDDPAIGWIERQVIQQIGDRLYGRS